MVRAAYSMAIDGDDLYISVLSIVNGAYNNTEMQGGVFWFVWSGESHILKLPKDGTGWYSRVGPDVKSASAPRNLGVSYTVTDQILSLGYQGNAVAAGPQTFDLYDWTSPIKPIIRSLMIIEENGTKKLLYVKEKQRSNGSVVMSELWKCDLDFSSNAKNADVEIGTRIEAFLTYSDIVKYVHFTTWSGGGSQLQSYLGLLGYNPATSEYFVQDYGRAILQDRFYSMSFFVSGIFTSGNEYDGNIGHNPNVENVASDGIRELYQCVFTLDGFNITHYRHESRNDYVVFPTPEVFIGGNPINFNTVKYAEEYLSGELFITTGWVLNLHTGELILRQAIPSTDPIEVTASYDFLKSVMFYEGDSTSRLDRKGLGKISQALNNNLYIDESESLRELPFVKSRTLAVRTSINSYSELTEDNGEYQEGTNPTGVRLSRTVGTVDEVVATQFTPTFTGKIHSIRIAVKLGDVSGGATLSPTYDVPKDFDLYISDDGVDFSSSDGVNITTPPTSADIEVMKEGTEQIYISYAKLDSIIDESQFYWLTFVVEDNKTLEEGKNYAIIFRCEKTGDLFHYMALGKDVSNANNLVAVNSITDGAAITTINQSGWNTRSSSGGGGAMLCYVEMKRQYINFPNVKNVLTLNDSYVDGIEFESLMSGANKAVKVVSEDFLTTYTGTDFLFYYESLYGCYRFYIVPGGDLDNIDNTFVVLWFSLGSSVLLISDTKGQILTESSEFGDLTTHLRIQVDGKKIRPADANVKIDRVFDLYPGILLELEQENSQTKKIEATNIEQWNEKLNKYELADDLTGESSKFVFDFNDPFIIGTTAYTVIYGKGHLNGANPDDHVESSTIVTQFSEDVPKFYRVTFGTAFDDTNYHVMIAPLQYREWRLAKVEDFPDMTDDNVIGTKPTDSDDVFTTTHCFIKRMNQSYGSKNCDWIAYESGERIFYKDENGVIVEDPSFTADLARNIFPSSYPDKIIFVKIEPTDFAGNPLFDAHSDSGEDGYDPDMQTDVEKYMSCYIDQVDIHAKGISAKYSNFDTQKKFLRITVVGYPVNAIVSIREEKRLPGFEHADAKAIKIDNNLIQAQAIAKRKVNMMMDFWGKERINFTKDVVFDPRVRPGHIAFITSDKDNLDNNAFYITSTSTLLSRADGFRQTLSKFLQI
jgi:hypothetical protein